jgi:hypothetical protein
VERQGNKMSIMKNRATFWRIIFFPVLLLMIIFMNSCAMIVAKHILDSPEKLAGTQKAGDYQGDECRNILIIGLIANTSQRVDVENAFTDRFTKPGLHPIVGSIIISDLASLKDKAIIDKLVQEKQIDKVITIEIKDVADKDMTEWLHIWLSTPLPKGDLTNTVPSRDTTNNVRFEISLWDAKVLTREWTGTTHPGESFDIMRHVYEAAASTVYTLINEKIIRPGK